ncbi:hypothetical protein L1887_17016 [Cichorium endivia]|nr:hypothetical protein L1887_17016 [Cichorium endivia]
MPFKFIAFIKSIFDILNRRGKMKYDHIFVRSFSRHDRKRSGYGALVGCFVVAFCLFTVFKSYLGLSPECMNLRLTLVDRLKWVMVTDNTSKPQRPYVETKETKLVCNKSKGSSDTCEMKGDIRIHGNSSTIFVFTSHVKNTSWSIHPYAGKVGQKSMETITNFTIKSIEEQAETMPKCMQTHDVPAIVFSIGGYAGNLFHAFADVIIPLYATSVKFNREVQFLVANKNTRWITRFQELLDRLSSYEIIDIDHENDVLCFPSMIVGLRREYQKELHTDPMKNFTKFLRHSYSLERSTVMKLTNSLTKRPRLLIISRQKTRAFTNVKDVVFEAQNLGFEVIVTEMNTNLTKVSRLVNSCDVMMGVHGAGLTNMVFMPENGVLIQVVPWGQMDWIANTYYGNPPEAMGLKYLEYKISERESTLINQYPLNHPVFVDPHSIKKKGYLAFKSLYLKKQNVTLDMARFRETLLKALELLKNRGVLSLNPHPLIGCMLRNDCKGRYNNKEKSYVHIDEEIASIPSLSNQSSPPSASSEIRTEQRKWLV